MNPEIRSFFIFMLTRNLAFVLFIGLLIPVINAHPVRTTFGAALKHAVALLLAAIIGLAGAAILPEAARFAEPALFFLLTLPIIRILQAWGELKGEWAGIPRSLLAYIPYTGIMLHLRAAELSGIESVTAAFGAATGYYLAFILIAAVTEQIRLSEATPLYKGLATLLFAIAIFAIALAGFPFA